MSIESKINNQDINIKELSLREQAASYSVFETKVSEEQKQELLGILTEKVKDAEGLDPISFIPVTSYATEIKILFPQVQVENYIPERLKQAIISHNQSRLYSSDWSWALEKLAELKIIYNGRITLDQKAIDAGMTDFLALSNKHISDKSMISFVICRNAKIVAPKLFEILEIPPHIWVAVEEKLKDDSQSDIYGFIQFMSCLKVIAPEKVPYHLLTQNVIKRWKDVLKRTDNTGVLAQRMAETKILMAKEIIVGEQEFAIVPPDEFKSPASRGLPEIKKF